MKEMDLKMSLLTGEMILMDMMGFTLIKRVI